MQGSFQIGSNEIAAAPVDPALYLVATPIGNLADVTLRALQVLASADIVACEDTRVTRTLLTRYGIRVRPVAYHEHNAGQAGPRLIAALSEGRSVALVSDAGTPMISDPGYRLVEQALAASIKVVPVPGASAPLAALVASGLPSDSFLFAGFLPVKDKARRDRLAGLGQVPATLLFFESPRRLAATLHAASQVLGRDREAAVCRELTKIHEEVRRLPLGALADHYAAADTVKGEVVIAIGPPRDIPASMDEAEVLLRELSTSLSPGQAATEVARRTGLPRKKLYQWLLEMKDG